MTDDSPAPARSKGFARAYAAIARHRVGAAVAFLAILPFVSPYEALAINILILGLYAVGFNLMFGYVGVLSFGHAAFLGAGAYGAGIAIAKFGIFWLLALPIGIAFSAFVALVVGYLAIRTRGIYFAMVTLALSQCFYYLVYQAEPWTGGENGLRGVNVSDIGLFGLSLLDPRTKYYVVLVFVALALWFLSRLLRSPFGAVLEAVRENEGRARACGYDVARVRLLAFVISGALCGLAGALQAMHLSIVPIETLHYITSAQAVMMALLGGMGTFFGPMLGAGAFLVIQDTLTVWTVHWQLFVGALFVVFVLFFPHGIWGSVVRWLKP